MSLSKSKIRKLGDKIRLDFPEIDKNDLDLLEEFRTSFKGAITKTYNELYKLSSKIYPNSVITFRIKRIESIISKLNRIPSMKLERMGDIAGCRCIVNSDKQVYRIRNAIVKNFNVKTENDYISKPQSDGYRSLHMYVECKESKKIVEFQIRSKEQHSWATLVEITDLIYEDNIKEKSGNEELKELLLLLSKYITTDSQKGRIIEIIKKYNFIKNLSDIFTRNYYSLRKQWLNTMKQGGHYFLIEASKDRIPRIESYSTFDAAENKYYSRYEEGDGINRVLTYLPRPSYKKISIAYSNYVLTYHEFMGKFFALVEDMVIKTLEDRKYLRNPYYFDLYLNQLTIHINNLTREIQIISENNKNGSTSKEWQNDLQNQIKKFENRRINLQNRTRKIVIYNPIAVQYLKMRYMSSAEKYKNQYNKQLK